MPTIEVFNNIKEVDIENNTIGKLLCIPKFFSSVTIECYAYGSAGKPQTWYEPEEYPELNVEDVVILTIDDEDGIEHRINKAQSKLIEHVIDDVSFEDSVWDILTDLVSTDIDDAWVNKLDDDRNW